MILESGNNTQTTAANLTGGTATPPTTAPAVTPPAEGGANVSVTPPGGEPNDPAKKPELKPSGLDGIGKKVGKTPADPTLPPAYQPNFKFKVLDKEHEMDEWLRNAIKDPDTEKKARELYEKAFGLDSVKQDRQTLKTELADSKEKIARTDQALEQIGEYARANDWDSFFESLKIPKDRILQYALQLVQREQDPTVKAQWEANRTATLATRNYNDANQQLTQRERDFAAQQKTFEYNQVTSRPEVMTIVQAYDAGMGKPGAFREYVIQIGLAHLASGKDIPAEQAVSEAIAHLRAVNPALGQAAPATPPSPQVVMPNTKPVLPNMGGRGTSPVRATIKSFDDLKQRSKELNSSGF